MLNTTDAPVAPPVAAGPVLAPASVARRTQAADRSPATQELILGCLPMVEAIARRVHGSLPPYAQVELHDLAQSGVVGLVSAGRCYDPATAVPFSVYARYRIEGEILDSLRRSDQAPRRLRHWQKQVSAAREQLARTLHRQPTEEELCDRLMVSVAEMRTRSLALNGGRTAPGAFTAADEEESSNLPSRPDTHPDHICAQRQLREVLDRLIESLPVRRRHVIRLYYGQHMTLKEIGIRLGVNESRVSQLHRGALATMAQKLRNSGIASPADL